MTSDFPIGEATTRDRLTEWAGWSCQILAVWLLMAFAWATAYAALAQPQVIDVQLSTTERETTVRFIVDQPIDFRVFTLASPLRLVLDMPAVDWRGLPGKAAAFVRCAAALSASVPCVSCWIWRNRWLSATPCWSLTVLSSL